MKDKKFLRALDGVDEEFLLEARPKEKNRNPIRIISIAASLVLVVGISLLVLLGGMMGQGGSNIVPDSGPSGDTVGSSPPYSEKPSIVPDNLYSELRAGEDYSRLVAILDEFGKNGTDYMLQFDDNISLEGGDDMAAGKPNENGSYINVTENQVEGVEEPDIFKMTDKYIFRIGGLKDGGEALRIYTLDKDNSAQVGEFSIPYFNGTKYGVGAKMLLSDDGKSVIIIKGEFGQAENNFVSTTTLMLIDTSDVTTPKLKKHITLNGMVDFTRSVDGKIILGTDFGSILWGYDWSNPEEYLPYYDDGEKRTYFAPEDIICPDEIYQRTYSSFFLLDSELNVTSNMAVFGITGTTYVSENKIVTSVGYSNKYQNALIMRAVNAKTDFAVIDYSSGSLKMQSVFTAEGWVNDRFFMDEKDGYLRVVTNNYVVSAFSFATNSSSLYIFRLEDSSLVAAVEDFSPKGEGATAVRFDGDKLYVCTALITINYIEDPVYFFDLSDYSNITQVNTGFIEGFSSVLITYDGGYLVGIGSLDSKTNKVSLYKREGDRVVTLSEYFFNGVHSNDRKAFIIDKENGLFGFQSGAYYDENHNLIIGSYNLLKIDGEELTEVLTISDVDHSVHTVRAVCYEGYLYLTLNMDIIVKEVE